MNASATSAPAAPSVDPVEAAPIPEQAEELDNPLWLLALPIFFIIGSLGFTFPMFPLYFKQIGLTTDQIFILLSLPGAVTLLANQGWGYVADVLLNRKWVLVLLCLCSAGTAFLFMKADQLPDGPSFPMLFVLMILYANFFPVRIPMVLSLIFSNRGGHKWFGPIRTVGSASFIGFCFLAGWAARKVGDMSIIFPLLIGAELFSAASLLPIRGLPRGRKKVSSELLKPSFIAVQKLILSNPLIAAFLLFTLVYNIPHNVSHQVQGLILRDLLADPDASGEGISTAMAVSIAALAEIPVFLFGQRFLERLRLLPVFLFCIAIQFLRWSMVAFHPTVAIIYLSNALHGLTFGLMYFAGALLMNREVPPSFRSSAQTMFALVYASLAGLLGPLFAAAFSHFVTHETRWWYAAAAGGVLLSLPLWFVMAAAYRKRHAAPEMPLR